MNQLANAYRLARDTSVDAIGSVLEEAVQAQRIEVSVSSHCQTNDLIGTQSLLDVISDTSRLSGVDKMSLPMWLPTGRFDVSRPIGGQAPLAHSGLLLADFDPPDKSDPPPPADVFQACDVLWCYPGVVTVWPSPSGGGLHVGLCTHETITTKEGHESVWLGSVPAWFDNLSAWFKQRWNLDPAFKAVNQRAFLPCVDARFRRVNLEALPLAYSTKQPPNPQPRTITAERVDEYSRRAVPEDFANVAGVTGWIEGKRYPCPLDGHQHPKDELHFGRFTKTGDLYVRCGGKHDSEGVFNLRMWTLRLGKTPPTNQPDPTPDLATLRRIQARLRTADE